ncbi:MAG: amino acid permease [Bacteroidales bacterium]|nr:amino acid permease [Bacteroidales bacterium]
MSKKPGTNSGQKLGLWMSTALVSGNMIGSGIFLVPAALALYGGISILGWLFSTAGAILLAIVFARLSRLVKGIGGPYIYARKSFGDLAGFLVVWSYWISIWSGNAAISVAGIGYLNNFWPGLAENYLLSGLLAISAIWFFTWVNTLGIRKVGFVQLVFTILKILPLIAIAIFGYFYFDPGNFKPFNLSGESAFSAIGRTAALTLWAFLGLESVTIPADKIKDPERTIPRATIFGTLLVAVIYIGSTVAVMGIISPQALANSTAPFADAANNIWNSWAGYAVAGGAVIACFGALNGWILLQGQLPMAAAKDDIFPKIFRRTSKKNIPIFGLVISSILATVLIFMNYTRGLVEMFTFIIMVATLATLLPYLLSTASELVINYRDHKRYNRKQLIGKSIISILAFLFSIWAVVSLGLEIIGLGLLLLLAGIPFYIWIKKREKEEEK